MKAGRGTHPYRLVNPLRGVVRIRLPDGTTVRLQVKEPVGTLVRKASTPDQMTGTTKDPSKSDRNYVVAAKMIDLLGHAGTALVVAATRPTAQRIARALAGLRPENPASAPLTDFVRTQPGETHPLVGVLRHEIGFHPQGCRWKSWKPSRTRCGRTPCPS
ncbi:hypothetical protein ACFQ08_05245 [Streptosporangium algeriense]|uniref:Uncharacterized protein n=1 Tax=Streptosporangium algeriense TaxID=1682748 RepID=A0ABW3DJA2_9ACTN